MTSYNHVVTVVLALLDRGGANLMSQQQGRADISRCKLFIINFIAALQLILVIIYTYTSTFHMLGRLKVVTSTLGLATV